MLLRTRRVRPRPHAARRAAVTACLTGAAIVLSGCALGQLVGGMAASAQRAGHHTVEPKYTGLNGKTFAVIVSTDRAIQGEFPNIVPVATAEMTKRLSDPANGTGATGVLPAVEVLRYQTQHPGWIAKSLPDLCKDLGVDRVVFVEVTEFALTDPGNPYLYNGVAAGSVRVVESDGPDPSEFTYNEPVRVAYPDQTGQSTEQLQRAQVLSELARRFIERSAWMFYRHEEPNVIKY